MEQTCQLPQYLVRLLNSSATPALVKLTYTGEMQEKEKEEERQRAEKTRQGREREGKERQGKIKSL